MGLVAYDSSDEDEDVQVPIEKAQAEKSPAKPLSAESNLPVEDTTKSPSPPTAAPQKPSKEEPIVGPTLPSTLGPTQGPSLPPPASASTEKTIGPSLPEQDQDIDMSFLESSTAPDPPKSPYTATRTLLRDLSLPPSNLLLDLSIPPSPPGSPTQAQAALTAKFDNFLKLKRTKGIHFNERLASNPGMRNPALTEKLLKFVGVEAGEYGEGIEQEYRTVMDKDVTGWDPEGFPAWARWGELRRQNERTGTRGRGERVEFVSGGAAGGWSGSVPPPVTGKRKGR
ncbi:hypothetical protein QBC43DRAFT_250085 [Cladorrhinum sp. PSN259]|nr:hypothetical protein QBC43DRAFT_250085 [Cladorrhinum sp. PSN259]